MSIVVVNSSSYIVVVNWKQLPWRQKKLLKHNSPSLLVPNVVLCSLAVHTRTLLRKWQTSLIRTFRRKPKRVLSAIDGSGFMNHARYLVTGGPHPLLEWWQRSATLEALLPLMLSNKKLAKRTWVDNDRPWSTEGAPCSYHVAINLRLTQATPRSSWQPKSWETPWLLVIGKGAEELGPGHFHLVSLVK